LAMKSGITEVPASRWDHSLFYNPDPRARGRTYCNVGAFHHFRISRKDLGIAPQDFRSMTDSTKLTLWLAEEVINQSGLLESGIPRERIGVLISQNSGEGAVTMADLMLDVNCHEIIESLRNRMFRVRLDNAGNVHSFVADRYVLLVGAADHEIDGPPQRVPQIVSQAAELGGAGEIQQPLDRTLHAGNFLLDHVQGSVTQGSLARPLGGSLNQELDGR